MDFASFFRGGRALRPEPAEQQRVVAEILAPASPQPTAEPEPSEIQRIIREAQADLGQMAHPEVLAAYIQARSMLSLAAEVAKIREMLQSGEAALTVGVETAQKP